MKCTETLLFNYLIIIIVSFEKGVFLTEFHFYIKFSMEISYQQSSSLMCQQTACLVVNPMTVDNFAFLFNYTPVGRTSDSMTVPTSRLIY